ncbi:hypothetical protein CHUAL_010415 [Chamberlinius hualienensis]
MGAFNFATLKRHPALIPLVVIIGAGCAMSSLYLLRLAVKSPEVQWNKHGNPEPWNDYEGKQYKFYGAGRDYSKVAERPKF